MLLLVTALFVQITLGKPAFNTTLKVSTIIDYLLEYSPQAWHRMLADREVCYWQDRENSTLAELERFTQQCTNRNWQLQELSASQISFKKDSSKEDKKAKPSSSTTAPIAANASKAAADSEDTSRVQEYLVFAVVLPMHPYSFDLMRTLSVVGPLFPHVGFVMGNGYRFTELVAKYHVRSFPRLLLFRKGKYSQAYAGEVSVRALTTHLALWGRRLPVARPYYGSYDAHRSGARAITTPHPDYGALETQTTPDAQLYRWGAAGLPQRLTSSWLRSCDPWHLEVLWGELRPLRGPGAVLSTAGAFLKEAARCRVDFASVARLALYRVPGNGPAVEPVVGVVPARHSAQLEDVLYSLSAAYTLARAAQWLGAGQLRQRMQGQLGVRVEP